MSPDQRDALEREVRDQMTIEELRAENERLTVLTDHFAAELEQLRRTVSAALAAARGEPAPKRPIGNN